MITPEGLYPFDIERVLAGDEVVTRDGQSAKINSIEFIYDRFRPPLCFTINGVKQKFFLNGRVYAHETSLHVLDLFMKHPPKDQEGVNKKITNQELLENAAYACGIQGEFKQERRFFRDFAYTDLEYIETKYEEWNPLKNDAQCFRMMFDVQRRGAHRSLFRMPDASCYKDIETFRKRVVEVVADIGQWMKENGL